jgi:hypothetical protein
MYFTVIYCALKFISVHILLLRLKSKWTECGEDCIVEILSLIESYLCDEIKEDEMRASGSTALINEKCVKRFGM